MSMNDREVVEAIRQLVLRPQPDAQYVAEIAREFARQVSSANHNLNRCQRWIQLGLFAEAVSFGEALDLAKSSARLLLQGMFGQWGELCRAANVPAPQSIDQSLLESYSDAWSRFHSLAQSEARHRLLSLQRAPLLERLQVLRELVALHHSFATAGRRGVGANCRPSIAGKRRRVGDRCFAIGRRMRGHAD